MIAEPGLVTKRQLSLASGVDSHCYASLDTRGALAAAMYARLAWRDMVRLSVPTECKATVARGVQWSNDGVQW